MLVGRGDELELLLEAARRPPSLVVVEGEAGVGKSRLVAEPVGAGAPDVAVSHRRVGRRVLIGHCHRLREPFPLGPVLEALRGLAGDPPAGKLDPVVGALRGLLPELAARLPPSPGRLGDPRAERHRVFRAVVELIDALGPAVVVLEDLHWADEATVELLDFLACRQPSGLCLALTYRREGWLATRRYWACLRALPARFSPG